MSNTAKKKLKRKRRLEKDRKRAGRTAIASTHLPLALPDRRGIEGAMASMFGGLSSQRGTPVERAQQIMYQAGEARDRGSRVALAHEALAISADCADAYLLLAEETDGLREKRHLLEEGVTAGERALGKRFFRDNAGHFWGLLETRPYMRTRAALAEVLWALGEREAALGHTRDLLRLDPNDNQGNRHMLVGRLIEMGLDDEAEDLLVRFEKDTSAFMAYPRALVGFRRTGDSEDARVSLRAALKENGHVPALLLGSKALPRRLPDFYGFGDEREAICYAAGGVRQWHGTPGALSWLSSVLAGSRAEPTVALQ